MKVSIIIPSLNEETYIKKTLDYVLGLPGNFEVIVVDGGSQDRTREIVRDYDAVSLGVSSKGRAHQMNFGAKIATGEVFLFLHADTFLPQHFYFDIINQLRKPEHIGGSFMLELDKKHPLLEFYTWCSKLSWELFTYGDHALFIKKNTFLDIGGFLNMPFMEDVEIQQRLRKAGKFRKLPTSVTTSARRFKENGTIQQLIIDVLLVGLYKLGVSPVNLKKFYKDHA